MSTNSPGESLLNAQSKEDEPERELWSGGFSGKSMIGSWIMAAFATLAIILLVSLIGPIRTSSYGIWIGLGVAACIWLYLLGVMVVRKLGIQYRLTTQELKHREGILFRKVDRVELIDIDDVNYQQGPIQALLGVGNITVRSSDASHPELKMYGIANISEIADMINDARRKERRSRGLHIESI